MKKIENKIPMFRTIALVVAVLLWVKCKQEPIVYQTSSNLNITAYVDQHPEQFSMFRRMMERTETDGFLQAYGKYTLFLPTNDGVKQYLTRIGKTSVDDIDLTELKEVVRFHILADTISTRKFGDGKINSLTMQGQYITTGASNTGGITQIVINKQATLISPNVRLGNGLVHIVDNVLNPAKSTVASVIESDPEYSIFTRALKETGWYDSLNFIQANNPVAKWKYLTVLAESNTVMKNAGFPTYEKLKARYSPGSGNPKFVADSLHMFIGYHIIQGSQYISDIRTTTAFGTLAPPEILSVKNIGQDILFNDLTFNGIYEPGLLLDRAKSNISASNGVVHFITGFNSSAGNSTGHLQIKVRKPGPVYWDVSDFPEIRALPAIFRTAGSFAFAKLTDAQTPINGWNWPRRTASTPTKTDPKYDMEYVNLAGMVYNDVMYVTLSVPTTSSPGSGANAWLEMKTPVIIKGKYKVWVCYKRDTQGGGDYPVGRRVQCNVSVDGVSLQKPFDFSETPPILNTMGELESQGWKYYMTNPVKATKASDKPNVGKLVGIIDIKSTNTHTIRLDVIQGNQARDRNKLDMIHFIPIDWPSQVVPRFAANGTADFTAIP